MAGNLNLSGNLSKAGTVGYVVVASGVCMTFYSSNWDPQDITNNGATCSTGNVKTVNCPAGTTKMVTFALSKNGIGGEGAICVK